MGNQRKSKGNQRKSKGKSKENHTYVPTHDRGRGLKKSGRSSDGFPYGFRIASV